MGGQHDLQVESNRKKRKLKLTLKRPQPHSPRPLKQPGETLRYELAAVNTLPTIRISRSIKSVLLSRRSLQWANQFTSRFGNALLAVFVLSLPLDIAVLCAHESVGRPLVIAALVCQVPALLLQIAALRVDMLQRLLGTYEFWFFSVMNSASCVAMFVHYQDARALSAVAQWIAIQINICVDADMSRERSILVYAVAALHQCCLLVAVALQLTPGTHTVTILHYGNRALSSNDALVNTIGTGVVLIIRTAYRKWIQRQKTRDSRTPSVTAVQCVNYRCQVKLRATYFGSHVAGTDTTGTSGARTSKQRAESDRDDQKSDSRRLVSPTTLPHASARLAAQQLRLAPHDTVFVDNDFVWPRAVQLLHDSCSDASRRRRIAALYAVGIIGLTLNLIPVIWRDYAYAGAAFAVMWTFALLCPTCFVAVFAAFYNRKLLRELVFSFDFCYFSAHITLVHACVCDLFIWDNRCFVVIHNWLAIHWILTLDALTPESRRRLALRNSFIKPVVAFSIIAVSRVSLDQLVFAPSRPVQDRVFWRVKLLDATFVEFRNLPFILNRAWPLLLWYLRLLWRLTRGGEGSCLIIQGDVEFAAHTTLLDRVASTSPTFRSISALTRRRTTQVHPLRSSSTPSLGSHNTRVGSSQTP
ncbi:hypothetical protein PybrP1_001225 [[Pythium] brassicae (nom. inval.)]|nr:hypothetical protein PybrP1_001225 [[Pythium] brassicae (nom. inval.)]